MKPKENPMADLTVPIADLMVPIADLMVAIADLMVAIVDLMVAIAVPKHLLSDAECKPRTSTPLSKVK